MKYRQLGRSALQVSELCLGTMNFGPRTRERQSFEIMSAARDAGINFFDTANQYGGHLGVGTTENIIGKWFKEDPTRRHKIVLATKVHEPMSDDINDRGLSARHIQAACDASLRRLGVDHIDLYQMHHIDRAAPVEEVWQAMERLIAQGKITYVGTSNFPGWAIAQASEKAIAKQTLGLVAEQGLYNLTERRCEMEVIPACIEYGLGFIVWSPLAGGLLAGKSSSTGRRQNLETQAKMASRVEQMADFEVVCAEQGASPSAVALSWLLHQQGVVSTIIGPGTLSQLTSVFDVPNISLSEAVLARLDEIFPPCGPSPEAYAW